MSFASWDLFRRSKVLSEYTIRTKTGGFFSILALTLLGILFCLELRSYLSVKVESQLVLDDAEGSTDSLFLRFDLSVLDLPCQYVQLDVYDYWGTIRFNVTESIRKVRIEGSQGELMAGIYWPHPEAHEVGKEPIHEHVYHEEPGSGKPIELTPDNFHQTLQTRNDSFGFVDFFASWCIYCQALEPTWKALASEVKKKRIDVGIYKVDCVRYPKLCAEEGIKGFPTMRLYHGDRAIDEDYMGPRRVDSFVKFLDEETLHFQQEDGSRRADVDEVDTREHRVQGCQLTGFLELASTPGSVRIHAQSGAHSFDPFSTNISHLINSISFSSSQRDDLLYSVRKKLSSSILTHLAILDNLAFVTSEERVSMDHYVKLVPTYFRGWKLYQMTATNLFFKQSSDLKPLPEIRLTYDVAPSAMQVTQKGARRWFEFLVNICAILGGVFTCVRLTDAVVFTIVKQGSKTN